MNTKEYNSLLKASQLNNNSRSKYYTEAQQKVFEELAKKYNITVDQVAAYWGSIGLINHEFMKSPKKPNLLLDKIVKLVPREPNDTDKNKKGDNLADSQDSL